MNALKRPCALLPSVVYRHFSPTGALLYVGSTTMLPERTGHHRVYSPWFIDDVTVEAVACGCLEVAREEEAAAIRAEFPRWNVSHRSKDHPDGPVRAYWDIAQLYPGTYHAGRIFVPYLEHSRRLGIPPRAVPWSKKWRVPA